MEGLEGPDTVQGRPNLQIHMAQQKRQLDAGLLHPKQMPWLLSRWITGNKQYQLFCQLYLMLSPNHCICYEAWDPLRKRRQDLSLWSLVRIQCERITYLPPKLPQQRISARTERQLQHPTQSTLNFGFQHSQVPLWSTLWSGAGFWPI